MILFSIIIPTFNSAKTIERCLESIISQTYKNIEVLVIDGVSKDNTIDIVKKYSTVSLISEPDKGIYDAMNKGIALAKGEWLYFLGSDDFLYNNQVFSKLSEEISNKEFDCLYGNVHIFEKNKIHMGKISRMNLFRKNISHQSIVYNKSIFHKLGKYNLNFPVFADLDYNFKLFFSDYKIKYSDLVLANFSIGGISSVPNPKHQAEKELIYKKAKQNFRLWHWIEFYFHFVKSRVLKYLFKSPLAYP